MATVLCVQAAPSQSASLTPQDCTAFASTPTFKTDHTTLCFVIATSGTTAVRVSTDGGHSYTEEPVVFVPARGAGSQVKGVAFSPQYASDGTLYLLAWDGIYRGSLTPTAGLGLTFTVVDPHAASTSTVPPTVVPFVDAATQQLAFVSAEGDVNRRINTPSGFTFVAGTAPATTAAFLVPPQLGTNGTALAIGSFPHKIYRCNAALACPTPVFTVPEGDARNAFASPDFAHDHAFFLDSATKASGHVLYRSADAGSTWRPWSGLMQAVRQWNGPQDFLALSSPPFGIAWDPSNLRRIYIQAGFAYKVHGQSRQDFMILRSDNAGKSFHRVAWAASGFSERLVYHGMIWNWPSPRTGLQMQVASDGTVFASGENFTPGHSPYYAGWFCSVDHGVHWAKTCSSRH